MTMRITLFTAILVQDSALSVSGLDREATSDQPFTFVDGKPILAGRGLKGAAVAMARRFFDSLPRIIAEEFQDHIPKEKRRPLVRSVWEFEDATLFDDEVLTKPSFRAGVGIRHKTGARAGGVLFDRETIPAGTRWKLRIRVDGSQALDKEEVAEAEGILGYVLAEHWAKGRCWLGGGVTRGLGWCRLEDLQAYRLEGDSYEHWIESQREKLPEPLDRIPTVSPTRAWFFRSLDLKLSFGEYRPGPNEPAWGLDMLAIGSHDDERTIQRTGDGEWARPPWAKEGEKPEAFETDRSLVMEGDRPLLPGSSLRGPLRHAFSRAARKAGAEVKDPHLPPGKVGEDDPAGQLFGTVEKSSRILIRDGRADAGWVAARLHMHAEDEFSAGSYGSSKRNAVRLLKGDFSVRLIVEGETESEVEAETKKLDRLIALGKLGHLPIGGHKTRGAGWGRWEAGKWEETRVEKIRDGGPSAEPSIAPSAEPSRGREFPQVPENAPKLASIRSRHGSIDKMPLTLGEAARCAQADFGSRSLVAWFCDPTIALALREPPATFGRDWPLDATLRVDEVAFYAEDAVWRAVRSGAIGKFVFIEEVGSDDPSGTEVSVLHRPARLHGMGGQDGPEPNRKRFSSADIGGAKMMLREWYDDGEILGFTMMMEERDA